MTRQPFTRPSSLESERALLGGLMLAPERIGDVIAVVGRGDFYKPEHAALFNLLVRRIRNGEAVDTVGLGMALATNAEIYGGLVYVIAMSDACPSTTNLMHYARQVRDVAIRRRLIDLAEEIAERAVSAQDPSGAVARAQEALARAHDGRDAVRSLGTLVEATLTQMQAVVDKVAPPALSTGYEDLDAAIGGGFRPGELTILAARPAMGKTALAMNIALRAAAKVAVGVFSIEMRAEQLVTRLLPMFSGVSLDRVVDARRLDERDWGRVIDGAEPLRGLPVWIDDTPSLTAEALASRARSMVAKGAGLIVVDYLGKMFTEGRDPTAEIGRNVSSLKNLARELSVPVLCLAQLNRGVEARADKRPLLSDLRQSGEVEQEADCVLVVYRDSYYNKDNPDTRAMEVIVRKARMGRVGTVTLEWDGALQLVKDGGGPLDLDGEDA